MCMYVMYSRYMILYYNMLCYNMLHYTNYTMSQALGGFKGSATKD